MAMPWKFLRTPRVVGVTCRRSRGVSGNALLWPGGVWLGRVWLGGSVGRRVRDSTESAPDFDNLHWPEPASGGNGWFWFRSCVV